MDYYISFCTNGFIEDLPVPAEVFELLNKADVENEKSCTISTTETALIVTCNNVEVLNYQLADSSDSRCISMYSGDVVDEIWFRSYDSASNYYKAVN